MQKDIEESLSAPLLNRDLTGSSGDREVLKVWNSSVCGKSYATGWTLTGDILIKWIQSKRISTINDDLRMSTQLHVTENKGIYRSAGQSLKVTSLLADAILSQKMDGRLCTKGTVRQVCSFLGAKETAR